ncbi:hypothetical protein [Chloroflexus sp.]|uniref:hypothetical protein n=1 Tax=Chloroflexus sp. TaxID=1904827 RepID=UPI00257F6AA1|nr:hypothetical protein [Chloroflexus sp.]
MSVVIGAGHATPLPCPPVVWAESDGKRSQKIAPHDEVPKGDKLEPVSKTSTVKVSHSLPTKFHDRDEHIWHPRDQPGQRRDTCRIVSTAGAAAWLPHSKRRHTRMMSEQGNQSSA